MCIEHTYVLRNLLSKPVSTEPEKSAFKSSMPSLRNLLREAGGRSALLLFLTVMPTPSPTSVRYWMNSELCKKDNYGLRTLNSVTGTKTKNTTTKNYANSIIMHLHYIVYATMLQHQTHAVH